MSELDLRSALADLADQADQTGGRDLAGAAWRTARRRRQRRVSAGAAAAVAVVAGLAVGLVQSGGWAPAPEPPVASGSHSPAPSPLPASPSSQSSSPSPAGVPAGDTTFASPSGGITCRMSAGWVACDEVDHRSWGLTRADLASCGQSALAGLVLPAVGKATFDCRTDVLVPSPQRVLGYGQSITVGDVTCASATTGVTCTNGRTGHGFFISRESYTVS